MANLKFQFQPTRLEIARRATGIGKIELAEDVGIDRRTLTNYLSGERVPSEEVLCRLASKLDIEPSFLFGSAISLTQDASVSFRSLARMSASTRDQALAQADLAFLLNRWFEERFELPPCSIPDLRGEATPEVASVELRRIWGLGEGPIGNVVRLFEAWGIRVYSLMVENADMDAVSFWRESTPFVLLNSLKTAERSRFDAAHELGHLVLHRHALTKSKDQENEANQFASAFLMPKHSLTANVPGIPRLRDLIHAKKIWRVSVAALAYRLNQIQYLNEWHYRMIVTEISKKGYRKSEPEPTHYDQSHSLPMMFGQLREEGLSRHHIARDLGLSPTALDRLLRGLMMTTIAGNAGTTASVSPVAPPPTLKMLNGGRQD